VAADNFWPELRALTRKLEVYLIADEVVSGFGRCGEWFAWQVYGEAGQPDLMTLAKGLTGAHAPLGAVVLSQVVAEHLEHEMLSTGLTYCGHPLACAADRGHRGLSGRAIDRTFKNAGRVHAEAIARS
jgi:taurine--2-oxoglutarate transaminase